MHPWPPTDTIFLSFLFSQSPSPSTFQKSSKKHPKIPAVFLDPFLQVWFSGILFHPFTFNLFVSLIGKHITCREHRVGSIYFFHPIWHFCLLNRMLHPFIFSTIIGCLDVHLTFYIIFTVSLGFCSSDPPFLLSFVSSGYFSGKF